MEQNGVWKYMVKEELILKTHIISAKEKFDYCISKANDDGYISFNTDKMLGDEYIKNNTVPKSFILDRISKIENVDNIFDYTLTYERVFKEKEDFSYYIEEYNYDYYEGFGVYFSSEKPDFDIIYQQYKDSYEKLLKKYNDRRKNIFSKLFFNIFDWLTFESFKINSTLSIIDHMATARTPHGISFSNEEIIWKLLILYK